MLIRKGLAYEDEVQLNSVHQGILHFNVGGQGLDFLSSCFARWPTSVLCHHMTLSISHINCGSVFYLPILIALGGFNENICTGI